MSAHDEQFRALCLNGLHTGGASFASICEAEAKIGLTFPKAYRNFLGEFGALVSQGIEIYGVLPTASDEVSIWQSVIEVAQELRKLEQAGTEREAFLPISDDGMGTYFFLDASSPKRAKVFAIGPGVESKVAGSFQEFAVSHALGTLRY